MQSYKLVLENHYHTWSKFLSLNGCRLMSHKQNNRNFFVFLPVNAMEKSSLGDGQLTNVFCLFLPPAKEIAGK